MASLSQQQRHVQNRSPNLVPFRKAQTSAHGNDLPIVETCVRGSVGVQDVGRIEVCEEGAEELGEVLFD